MDHTPPIEEILTTGTWTQFQLYGVFPQGIELMLAGPISKVVITDEHIFCESEFTLRAGTTKGSWEHISAGEPFRVPGKIKAIKLDLLPSGRLVMVSSHPKETTVTVFFPEGDTGIEEILGTDRYGMVDLKQAQTVAQPQARLDSRAQMLSFEAWLGAGVHWSDGDLADAKARQRRGD